MEVIIELGLYKVVYERAHCGQVTSHIRTAELGFGLAFKNGLHHLDANGRNDGFTDVAGLIILIIEFADGFYQSFTKSGQMRSALRSVLSVHKAVVFLAV